MTPLAQDKEGCMHTIAYIPERVVHILSAPLPVQRTNAVYNRCHGREWGWGEEGERGGGGIEGK